MTALLGAATWLASTADEGKAPPFALFIVLALGVGIFFLVRSMIKHLRRVPPSFDDQVAHKPEPERDPEP